MTLLGTAATALPLPCPSAPARRPANASKIGVPDRHVRPLPGPRRARRDHRGQPGGGRGIRRPGKGFKVEVLSADHQNKPDVGATIARQWYRPGRRGRDRRGARTPSVALAVAGVAKEKNKVYLNSGAATSDLTGAPCNAEHDPLGLRHLHAGASRTGGAMVKAGGDSWFFITADYAFGQALQRDTTDFMQRGRRQGAGRRRVSVPGHDRFLVLPAAGAGLAAPRCLAWPMPAPTRSTRSSRPQEFGITR